MRIMKMGDERDDEEGDECRPEVQEENDPQGRGRTVHTSTS